MLCARTWRGMPPRDSRSAGEFSDRDISFLQGAANLLGMAIERQRIEQSLLAAVERNQLLLKEVNHRVNNSLALVASMLHLKSATVSDEVKLHLEKRLVVSAPSPELTSGFTKPRCSRKLI